MKWNGKQAIMKNIQASRKLLCLEVIFLYLFACFDNNQNSSYLSQIFCLICLVSMLKSLFRPYVHVAFASNFCKILFEE